MMKMSKKDEINNGVGVKILMRNFPDEKCLWSAFVVPWAIMIIVFSR